VQRGILTKKIKVNYITYLALPVGPNSGVIRTQVYELLKGIIRNCPISISIRWSCFLEKKSYEENKNELQKLNSEMSDLHISVITLPNRGRFIKFLKAIICLLREYLEFLPNIIHFRPYQPILFSLLLRTIFGRRFKIIFDPRGAFPEEQRQKRNWKQNSLYYKLLKILEILALKKSDFTICMSKTLEQHYRGIWHRGNYAYIPPCVDFQRFDLYNGAKKDARNKYQIPANSLILLYSGSFDWPWSISKICGEIFSKIKEKDPETYLLILSNSEESKIIDILLTSGIEKKDIIIYSPNYSEIPSLTNAADIGLVVREESIINKVAYPIKFLEYLASGIPVITTKANLFISQIAEDEKIGLIYRSGNSDFMLKFEELVTREIRIRCKSFSKFHDIKEISKRYIKIYLRSLGYHNSFVINKLD